MRRRRPHVDGHVENLCGHGFIIKAPISVLRVEVAVVDGDGVGPGEVGDVQVRIATLRDAILGLTARVGRIVDVAALVFQHHLHGPPKTLVRDSAHIVTVTSLRLPLSRMCAGPRALGRYPLRSAYPPQSSSALPLT